MTEAEWASDDEPAPKKKKLIPRWVLFGCGAGCLVLVVVIGVVAAFAYTVAQDATNPEKAWPTVAKYLPHDERPEGWEALGTSIMGQGTFHLQVPGDSPLLDTPEHEDARLLIQLQTFGLRQGLDDIMDPESQINTGVFGVGAISDAQEGTIEVQGREVPCLRFGAWLPDSANEDGDKGKSVRIDLTGEGKNFGVITFTALDDTEPSDELIQQLLSPFDVWRDK